MYFTLQMLRYKDLPPQLEKLQRELDEFYIKRTKGAFVPCKLKWIDQKNSKYFF